MTVLTIQGENQMRTQRRPLVEALHVRDGQEGTT
jgi:hypothetical protein